MPLKEPVKVLPYDEADERADLYSKLFTKELKYKDVKVHRNLSKIAIIRELKDLK